MRLSQHAQGTRGLGYRPSPRTQLGLRDVLSNTRNNKTVKKQNIRFLSDQSAFPVCYASIFCVTVAEIVAFTMIPLMLPPTQL